MFGSYVPKMSHLNFYLDKNIIWNVYLKYQKNYESMKSVAKRDFLSDFQTLCKNDFGWGDMFSNFFLKLKAYVKDPFDWVGAKF